MRKTLLLVLLFSALLCKAQNYQSFFGQHKTEYNVFADFPCYGNRDGTVIDPNPNMLGCGVTFTFTVINQDTIQKNGKSYMPVVHNCWMWNHYEDMQIYVREDVDKGQLFCYYSDFETEILMCDMSLNTGDTFVTPYSPYFPSHSDNVSLVVDSVFYANNLKTIRLKKVDGYDEVWKYKEYVGLCFIEGTGPVYGPFTPITGEGLNILLCVSKDDTLTYMVSPLLGCDQWGMPVNNYSTHSLVLYPNPSTGLLTLSLDNEGVITDGDIIILDISGRVVKTQNISSKKSSIDISLLKKGFYTFRYTNVQQEVYVSKFIKM